MSANLKTSAVLPNGKLHLDILEIVRDSTGFNQVIVYNQDTAVFQIRTGVIGVCKCGSATS